MAAQISSKAPISAPTFQGRVVAVQATANNGVAAHQFGAPGLNKISMHLGDGDATAAGVHDFSAALRFGGSGVAWGDLAYFPKAGLQDGGKFRLSTAGDALNTAPNASLGVGSLYSAGPIKTGVYTLATLPSPLAYEGCLIIVSNAPGGQAVCHSNGAGWISTSTNGYIV